MSRNDQNVRGIGGWMQEWIHGCQIKEMGQLGDAEILQGCITKSLTPHDGNGLPFMPGDVMVHHISDLEQELTRLDEIAWDLSGAEREQMIRDDIDPLQERLQACRTYLESIKAANWDEFELPAEQEMLGRFSSFMVTARFPAGEVEKFLRKPSEVGGAEETPPSETRSARSLHAQRTNEKCREIAKRIWERQPYFTIAAMINHSEVVRQARKPDGSPYSEITIRNWIRDLCPNPRPGRRSAAGASE
jgi:preprotein translocase subunit Sss1